MPKVKTHSGAKKRFKKLKSGLVKRSKAFHRHLMSSKSPKRKRGLRKATFFAMSDLRHVRAMLL